MFGVMGGIEVDDDPVDGRDGYADEPELLGPAPPVLLLLLQFTSGEGDPTAPAVAEAASRVALTFFSRELSIAAETPPLSESSRSNLIVLAPLGSGGTPAPAEDPGSPGAVCLSDALALGRRERLRRSATRASASARSSSVTFVICTSRSGSSYSYTVDAGPEDDAEAEDE